MNKVRWILQDVLREIVRRYALRRQLEWERGRAIDDAEFLKIAEAEGFHL